jgi:hypothetical protein
MSRAGSKVVRWCNGCSVGGELFVVVVVVAAVLVVVVVAVAVIIRSDGCVFKSRRVVVITSRSPIWREVLMGGADNSPTLLIVLFVVLHCMLLFQ